LRCEPAVEQIGDSSQLSFGCNRLVFVIDNELGEGSFSLLAASSIVMSDHVLRRPDFLAGLGVKSAVDLDPEAICVASDCAHSPPFRSLTGESKVNGWCDRPVQLCF
jgi:hypothetical protein